MYRNSFLDYLIKWREPAALMEDIPERFLSHEKTGMWIALAPAEKIIKPYKIESIESSSQLSYLQIGRKHYWRSL